MLNLVMNSARQWCKRQALHRNARIAFRCSAAAILLFTAASCTSSAMIESFSKTKMVSPDKAFATPSPGGPAIVGIVETAFRNGKQQDIALAVQGATSGQNLLRVQIAGVVDTDIPNGDSLPLTAPSETTISREIAQLMPGVSVKRSPYFLQNQYGPFSYAAGRSGAGDICLYAWQHIGKVQSRKTVFSPRGAIQLRLRLCDPVASERELLEKMYGININAAVLDARWDPYGSPDRPPAGWGRPGYALAPVSIEGFSGVVPERIAPVKSRPGPARASAQEPDPVKAAASKPVAGGTEAAVPSLRTIVPAPPAEALEGGGAESTSSASLDSNRT